MTEKKTRLVEIKVTVGNHTHKGRQMKAGDKIKVSPETAEMLKKEWSKEK